MIERSKRTGRFVAKRKHKKKALTRAQETLLYHSMAEKYMVLAFRTAPKSWTLRRRDILYDVHKLVTTHTSWIVGRRRYWRVSDIYKYAEAMDKARGRRYEKLGIDWEKERAKIEKRYKYIR